MNVAGPPSPGAVAASSPMNGCQSSSCATIYMCVEAVFDCCRTTCRATPAARCDPAVAPIERTARVAAIHPANCSISHSNTREPKKNAGLNRSPALVSYLPLPQLTLTASTSMLILMSLPTVSPPPSSSTFHVRPNSRRSILPCALNPARSPPHGSFVRPSN